MKRAAQSLIAIILAVLLAVTLAPSLPAHEGDEEQGNEQGEASTEPQPDLLEEGDPAPPFVLTDQDHKKIALSDFGGRPRFLTFIHTHCKDICPLVLQDRHRLEKEMEPEIGTGIVFLAVTMDPQNDTPDVLKAFIGRIGVDTGDLHLLSGEVQDVRKVLQDYSVNVLRDTATGHVVTHAAVGYAIDKDGIIKGIYNFSL